MTCLRLDFWSLAGVRALVLFHFIKPVNSRGEGSQCIAKGRHWAIFLSVLTASFRAFFHQAGLGIFCHLEILIIIGSVVRPEKCFRDMKVLRVLLEFLLMEKSTFIS